MNVDPTFVLNPSLPDVPAARTAFASRLCGDRQHDACSAPVRLEPPGTDPVWFIPKPQPFCYGFALDYERAQLDAMPALHRAWQRSSAGEGARRFDQGEAIASAISRHNAAASSSSPTPLPDGGPPGPPGAGTGGTGGGGGGAGGTGGAGGSADPIPATPTAGGGGCSCGIGGPPAGWPALALPLGFGLTLLARRKRHPDKGANR